jgi:hypothetical protein
LIDQPADTSYVHHPDLSASNHAKKTGHLLAMNVQRTRKPDSHQRSPSAEPPLKKLAIAEQTEDQFDIKTSLIYYPSVDERKQFSFSEAAEPKVSNLNQSSTHPSKAKIS